MVKAVYCPEERKLTISGHADYAPAGQDIVCAGISAVIWAVWSTLIEEKGPGMTDDGERICIVLPPKDMCNESAEAILAVAVNGLSLIAEAYPEHVVFTIEKAGGTDEEQHW